MKRSVWVRDKELMCPDSAGCDWPAAAALGRTTSLRCVCVCAHWKSHLVDEADYTEWTVLSLFFL